MLACGMKASLFVDFYVFVCYHICVIDYFNFAFVKEFIMAKRGRPRTNNTQVNMAIPSAWKYQLDNLARIFSIEESRTVTSLELIRRAVAEKYQLEDKDGEQ